tara:strand:- start:24 stop:794 length:771 start_codon:yes stop_codon:yes gene_type:complete
VAPPFAQKPSKFSQMSAAASRARTSKADISRDLDIARGRKEFFSNRPDVSDDRALRRMTQADETQRFKNLYTKPVAGSSNLLQMTADAPRSLAQEKMRLANMYGPTFKEIGSDIAAGIGSMARGIAEKGTPLMQLGKGVLGGIQNFFSNVFNPGNISGQLQAAGPQAQQQYAMLMQQPGMTYQKAFEMATGNPFTSGQASNVSSGATDELATFKQGLTDPQLAIFNFHYNSGNSPDYSRQMALMGVPMAQGGVASL